MIDDLVTRLRKYAKPRLYSTRTTMLEAADEIERLRAEATAFVLRPEDRLVVVVPHGTTPADCEMFRAKSGLGDRVLFIGKMEAHRD